MVLSRRDRPKCKPCLLNVMVLGAVTHPLSVWFSGSKGVSMI